MAVSFYLDEHIPRAITNGLRLRGVDVLTAQEDGRSGASDADLLDRATELGRILVTFDDDLLTEAATRQRSGESFSGVICKGNARKVYLQRHDFQDVPVLRENVARQVTRGIRDHFYPVQPSFICPLGFVGASSDLTAIIISSKVPFGHGNA